MKLTYITFGFATMLLFQPTCREPYNPPAIAQSVKYLVVDGFLNIGDSTIITLSRTRSLADSVSSIPETGATVWVVGEASDQYPITEIGNGVYGNFLPLNLSERYQLMIITADGKKYASDSVAIKQTPPIDSVNFASINSGVQLYVNTHDPSGNTKYYRWEYEETWEYHPAFESMATYSNGQLISRTASNSVYTCWHTQNSTELLLATSATLSQDIIYLQPLIFIPQTSQKISVKYSILVKQFSLTEEAYDFWLNQKKNSELTGNIFAPLPSQSNGNIHCISDPNEPCLGYISASSVQQQRIYINNADLPFWQFGYPQCYQISIPPDSFNFYFGMQGYLPLSPHGISDYWGTFATCADCTLNGGTTVKPSFWP